MYAATGMCTARDHNCKNCTDSFNVWCCTLWRTMMFGIVLCGQTWQRTEPCRGNCVIDLDCPAARQSAKRGLPCELPCTRYVYMLYMLYMLYRGVPGNLLDKALPVQLVGNFATPGCSLWSAMQGLTCSVDDLIYYVQASRTLHNSIRSADWLGRFVAAAINGTTRSDGQLRERPFGRCNTLDQTCGHRCTVINYHSWGCHY